MLRLRKLTVISILTAAAVSGRLLIHGVNIQPATLIVILTGWFFGWKAGLAEGLMVGLVTDMILELGYWTPFQMAAWGLIGLISHFIPKKVFLYVSWLGVSGYVFGLIMAFSYFLMAADIKIVLAMYASGLLFDTYHAVGNLMFGLLSPLLFKVFRREQEALKIK
ncbi:ECF transporter S component [Sporolactobacillus shoreae]|uniref:ECF transporter S component n=1 Tax=Sporolactobacillus shoreae TaxID=1465501 RepID=A0A4Z0GRM4_9BACL|nr:ECF transporter S component [Sporolactobacillus shoreae]TGA99825.1 ECF transporter S component [Sporolactobacillus shoreae]